jgi:phage terminase large subunit-like protein
MSNPTSAELLQSLEKIRKNYINTLFPDTGPLRRELYPKHMEFFAATKDYTEVAFIAANRVGKSLATAYATTLFLTGEYPDWWVGRRFEMPTNILVAGENAKLVRDSIQEKFLGPPNDIGTGLIPYDKIIERRAKAGTADAVDTVRVKSKYGVSNLQFGSYDAGREAFQATARHVVLCDEEPPVDIYGECLMRVMSTSGLVMCAFTPLKGISEVVLSFMPGGKPAVQKGHDHGLEIRL